MHSAPQKVRHSIVASWTIFIVAIAVIVGMNGLVSGSPENRPNDVIASTMNKIDLFEHAYLWVADHPVDEALMLNGQPGEPTHTRRQKELVEAIYEDLGLVSGS